MVRGPQGSRSRSQPQGPLEHTLIRHLMGQRHHQAPVLLHRLADDLVRLRVPGPAAAGHLPAGRGEGVQCRCHVVGGSVGSHQAFPGHTSSSLGQKTDPPACDDVTLAILLPELPTTTPGQAQRSQGPLDGGLGPPPTSGCLPATPHLPQPFPHCRTGLPDEDQPPLLGLRPSSLLGHPSLTLVQGSQGPPHSTPICKYPPSAPGRAFVLLPQSGPRSHRDGWSPAPHAHAQAGTRATPPGPAADTGWAGKSPSEEAGNPGGGCRADTGAAGAPDCFLGGGQGH